jgi:hypothetical protein
MAKLYFQKVIEFNLFVFIFLIGFTSPAYAYIDPGSSAYLIQALVALVAAVVFYIRHPITLIKDLFKKIFKKIIHFFNK